MVRYKRIRGFFFTDTFFATSKAGKSTRGNTCAQIFVTDKGFIYLVSMKYKKDMPKALKQFCKEIGAPGAIRDQERRTHGFAYTRTCDHLLRSSSTTLGSQFDVVSERSLRDYSLPVEAVCAIYC